MHAVDFYLHVCHRRGYLGAVEAGAPHFLRQKIGVQGQSIEWVTEFMRQGASEVAKETQQFIMMERFL
jgi:hypothetical protein